MQKINDILVELLKTDERYFTAEGELLKNAVYEDAMKMDSSLIKLLLSDDTCKSHFFTEVDGVLVFDKVGFGWVINNRQFLPDSYTRYKNKIGLVDSVGDFISSSDDVVLAFPYKDCVLEGGQTREEQKKDEIFYNETLAPDEVDRLLYPKVFTGARRYTKDGTEENITFDENDNLIIKGNNLLAISSLLKRYEGKVKLIYIDPPYNTGNDGFKYNDSFNHSTWLTFMKNRLEIAKRLLAPDGSIYVQIDNNELHYLKVLMDDIFGMENFQREIVWVLKGVSGYKSLINNFVRGHDTILYYSKGKDYIFNKLYLPYSKEQLARFSSVDEDGRRYKTITKERRLYLDEAKGVPLSDVWDDIASFQTVVNAEERTGFSTQKPEKLIQRIIESSSNQGDIVLDFHMGSGTTCATAMKLNRRFIGVEQMDYIDEITIPRLIKVIGGDTGGISKEVDWQGGGSFVYCELARLNQKFIDDIEKANTDEALVAILGQIIKSGFISSYVDPKEINPETEDFKALSIDDKKRLLIALLDKNMLYVNYCDMNDETFAISESDKAFTDSFYGEA
ncbi:MAG: site-specific DNA-methyltransferase [Clostridia bacterium]|nr:site-specific DNA-methyltransferase [Clostridia bacterium]